MEKLVLSTGRLVVRNLHSSDVEDFHRYRSNPDVTRYQGFDVMNRAEAASFILEQADQPFGQPGAWVQYGIALAGSGHLVGDCGLYLDKDLQQAQIGITISHLEQKKGYAKEALLGIMAFLFEVRGIHRITETVDADNTASIQLLKSAGFRVEGHFIENIFFKGRWGSEYQFALLRREWREGSVPFSVNV